MLPETQKILHKFYDFHHRSYRDALPDLKPKMTPYSGGKESTAYGAFEEMSTIYQLMYSLYVIVDGDLFRGDYDVCFLYPKEVVEKITEIYNDIKQDTESLRQIHQKYEDMCQGNIGKSSPSSIYMVYLAHTEILKTLNHILLSDEIAVALEPGIIEKLRGENRKVQFESYWDKYLKNLKWKLVIYILLVVIPIIMIFTLDSSYKYVAIAPIVIPFIDSFISKEGIIDLIKIIFSAKYRTQYQEKLYKGLYT